ncbi:MAG: ABC transporter ATP-binding protein [Methanobacterium sp.]|nr:ABC transporter ATP-binding protein [Methanobacterium sp.]
MEYDEYVIQTSSLTKKFGDFTAINDLNLKIKKGEIYGLLGPNGAGKTTTIRLLCGLINYKIGEAYVLGTKVPDHSISQQIGYMPQETALYKGLSVQQNMEFFGEIYGLDKQRISDRIDSLLEFIDLQNWKNELVENLSGGMKHRVSLVCALIHEPKLLFLDEPTVGVDPELRVSFWKYFDDLKNNGVSILITTHYMDEARHCDRIGFMKSGTLIAEDEPAQLLKVTGKNSLEDAFLMFSREVRE